MQNDLISRSALQEKIKTLAQEIARENGGVDHVTFALKVAFDFAKEAPAVDAEPVKHGIWEADPNMWQCSECRRWLIVSAGNACMNFCTHCGARMDGRGEG